MTQSEFIAYYCKNSKMSEKRINELGEFAVPCECGEEDCLGWAMITKEDMKSHAELYLH